VSSERRPTGAAPAKRHAMPSAPDKGAQRYGGPTSGPQRPMRGGGIIAEHVYPEERSEDAAAPRKLLKSVDAMRRGPKKRKTPDGC